MFFRGDTVKLHDGQVVEIIDLWGVARQWYKLKPKDGPIFMVMEKEIQSLVSRPSNKTMKGRSK